MSELRRLPTTPTISSQTSLTGVAERDARTDRLAAGPEASRGFLVDHRHWGRVCHFRVRDRASALDRNLHRPEIVAGDR